MVYLTQCFRLLHHHLYLNILTAACISLTAECDTLYGSGSSLGLGVDTSISVGY